MALQSLVGRLVDEIRPTLEKHTLLLRGSDKPLMIEGDELRLEQAIQNLIGNAIKYSPVGGAIHVRVEQRDNHACVAVSDQGIGIPAEALAEIFERFYRAKNAGEQQIPGMGLGLYVVKQIVILHDGEIHVESKEGAGSTFTICLPLLQYNAATPGCGSSRAGDGFNDLPLAQGRLSQISSRAQAL